MVTGQDGNIPCGWIPRSEQSPGLHGSSVNWCSEATLERRRGGGHPSAGRPARKNKDRLSSLLPSRRLPLSSSRSLPLARCHTPCVACQSCLFISQFPTRCAVLLLLSSLSAELGEGCERGLTSNPSLKTLPVEVALWTTLGLLTLWWLLYWRAALSFEFFTKGIHFPNQGLIYSDSEKNPRYL